MTTYVIGEAGSCHEESLDKAILLIDTAQAAGCNAVKFQYWSDPARMRVRRNITDTNAYTTGSISREWLPYLLNRCLFLGIDLMCSAYLPEDVEFLSGEVDAIKISSFEALDAQLVKSVPSWVPLYISTGMCTSDDIMRIFANVGDRPFKLLHCVSSYPCPVEQAALHATQLDGYSDHTLSIHTGGLAVAAGYHVIETHFRLDETPETCPDYCVAHSPVDLGRYVKFIRMAEAMCGGKHKEPQECEKQNMRYRVLP